MRPPAIAVLALCFTFLLTAGPLRADDWPQWMGPHGNATADAGGLLRQGFTLRKSWSVAGGQAYSSISAAGGRAVTLEFDEATGYDMAVALDAATGQRLWRVAVGAGDKKAIPCATPAIHGGRVYALTAAAVLVALDAEDGHAVWRRDLAEELGASPPSYGMSTSPLVVDGRIVVLVGGTEGHNLAAFDAASGEASWSTFHAKSGSYSSPILATLAGQRQLVVPAFDHLYAARPEDGALLWSFDGTRPPYPNPVALPEDRLFLSTELGGAVVLRVRKEDGTFQVARDWSDDDLGETYSPAVYQDGVVYGLDRSHLVAFDAAHGHRLWEEPQPPGSLMIAVDGRLAVLTSRDLSVHSVDAAGLRAGPSVQLFDAVAAWYAPPSFAGGRFFVRNASEIVAVSVVAADSQKAKESP